MTPDYRAGWDAAIAAVLAHLEDAEPVETTCAK